MLLWVGLGFERIGNEADAERRRAVVDFGLIFRVFSSPDEAVAKLLEHVE